MSSTLDSIRLEIAKGEIGESIEKLLAYTQGTKQENNIILQASRYNSIQKELDNNTVSIESAKIEIARISNALLNLIDKLKKESPQKPAVSTEPENLTNQSQKNISSSHSSGLQINRTSVFEFLERAFTDEALQNFCYKYFEKVYDNFGAIHDKTTRVRKLLEYCDQHLKYPYLLDKLKKERTELYQEYEALLMNNQ